MRKSEVLLWIAAAVLAVTVTAVCLLGTPGGATPDKDATSALTLDEDGAVAFQLDLNTADQIQLMRLSGMTALIAKAILDYRDYYGGFSDVLEIGNVPGVTAEMRDRWTPYLTLGDRGTESSS